MPTGVDAPVLDVLEALVVLADIPLVALDALDALVALVDLPFDALDALVALDPLAAVPFDALDALRASLAAGVGAGRLLSAEGPEAHAATPKAAPTPAQRLATLRIRRPPITTGPPGALR
ncbi:MAG: hypothetical protein FWD17_13865 [Polyangiaceae bacterium]|nr:hypothetical protein [Polyangiaceae bacterium]